MDSSVTLLSQQGLISYISELHPVQYDNEQPNR